MLPLQRSGENPGEGALISACMELRWGHGPVRVGRVEGAAVVNVSLGETRCHDVKSLGTRNMENRSA